MTTILVDENLSSDCSSCQNSNQQYESMVSCQRNHHQRRDEDNKRVNNSESVIDLSQQEIHHSPAELAQQLVQKENMESFFLQRDISQKALTY